MERSDRNTKDFEAAAVDRCPAGGPAGTAYEVDWMKGIDKESLAEIEFRLKWRSREGEHTDAALKTVNFWRDLLPEGLSEKLMGASAGDAETLHFEEGPGAYSEDLCCRIPRGRFDEARAEPRCGRFYPKGVLKGFYHIFPQNVEPVRCVGVEAESVAVDFNHPLAGRSLELTAVVQEVISKPFDRGGQSRSLMESVADGPGMQARFNGKPTDFLGPNALRRLDEAPDPRFYEKPRRVNHIDDRAIEKISSLYGRFLKPDMAVLDLMSAWRSHVPPEREPRHLVGLGMNAEEMRDNPQLTEHLVHDLNSDPRLPFADEAFDCILCTASVEYLTRPAAVFKEAARVLKPGGRMVHTFSNRWFPPKAIRLWSELHEFERMGLVLEYFHRSGGFTDLATFSACGWARPETDRHFPDIAVSDPVYAVWGTRKAG
jgi:FKBP-type peptidyl-prolyl cis-trans isomerase 2